MSEVATLPDIAFLEGERVPASNSAIGASVVVVGMPELVPGGLCETWLLKTCGHRHWLMLARAFGQLEPDFRDAAGRRLYPSFVALRLDEARLDAVQEGARLIFEGDLVRISRTRFMSRQLVLCNGRPVARIEMISVFVFRESEGCNERIARGLPAGAQCLLPEAALPALALRHHDVRRLQAASPECLALRPYRLDPCPLTDFNGAGFLYFASFQAFLDRAHWHWHRDAGSTTLTREIHYFGNAGAGVPLAVECLEALPGSEWTECRVRRLSDEATIAFASTRRGRRRPA